MIVSLFTSCKLDDDNNSFTDTIIGKWKLIEQLTDPGDGSGTFQTIASDRVIEFFSDGTVSINGELCYMGVDVGDTNTGVYELFTNTDSNYDGEIVPDNCNLSDVKVNFTLPLSGNLILWYQCIEPCAQKFVKVQ